MTESPSNAQPSSSNQPLDLATLTLRIDERGRLIARHDDQDVVLAARRAFPWSDPSAFISLRNKEGVELALIETLESIPEEARSPLREFLAQATFVPRIMRIEEVNLEHGYQLWKVQTESGPIELRVQEREDIRFLGAGRFSLKDANGSLYEIADLAQLDDHSQRQAYRLL